MAAMIEPFTLAVADAELEDLRARLRATRWPEPATDPGQGVPLERLRQRCARWAANRLDPRMVGDTYGQLLRMSEPKPHVAVGSPDEPFATQGFNAEIQRQIFAVISAIPLDTP